MSDQVCRFCQRYVKLTYYCEECGTNCCSDCLHEKKIESYTCQECDSKNIDKSGSKKLCNECGNETFTKGTQYLKSCPKCGSPKILNIYEKKEDLEKEFLDLIKKSRLFVNPLREVLSKLLFLRKKVRKAREPPIKCFHYPKMESDIFSLFKLFIYVQNTLVDKINAHFHQLILYKEYFFDIYAQPNTNITIIEGILDNLLRSYSSINDFVLNNVETFNTSAKTLEQNMNFIDKISIYFFNYQKFLNLAEKEKPVYAIYAKLVNGLDTEARYKKDKGSLFITNFDLSFVHEYGVRKKKRKLIFKAPVQDLIRIKEKGKIFKKLYLEFEYGKYEFTLPAKSISRVIEYILLARTFDETTIYDKTSATNLQRIDIDLNELVNFIEESINSFFSLKCQYNKNNENVGNYINTGYQNVPVQFNQFQNVINPNHFQPVPNYNSNFRQIGFNQSQTQNFNDQYVPSYSTTRTESINPVQSEFFIQNLHTPNRFQNYNAHKISNGFNYEEQYALMKKLEENQRNSLQFSNQPNNNSLNDKFRFQEYGKNHLSGLFNPNGVLPNQQSYKKKLSKLDSEKQQKMFDLQKKRYSLKATLKKLETKYDQGSISDSDYFKTYRNLQQEFYLIKDKINKLEQFLNDLESSKHESRNFDNEKFFT
ncbi:hypothetical protein LCGC14_0616310 [marine sediment metagenome]|uniref:SB domain-containing protein n=1 Tax=marine sediment metagenome TaxID=412755 RepID=A0A0F9UEN8_9ZZZZ